MSQSSSMSCSFVMEFESGASANEPVCFLCSRIFSMSSPFGLWIAVFESEIAIIFAPSFAISFAKFPPAFPLPWIATVAFSSVGIICVCSIACFSTNCPPLAVAVSRPSEPPFSRDFPVTTALAFSMGKFSVLEYSSTIMSIIFEFV